MIENRIRLPLNCNIDYFPNFLNKEDAQAIYSHLMEEYQVHTHKLKLGEHFESDYGKLMFMDEDLYRSQQLPKEVWGENRIWSPLLNDLKMKVEELAQNKFQVGVCIYYPDGNCGVDYHSDRPAFGDTTLIPSLSLGASRKFSLREKSSFEEYDLTLQSGSLLLMGAYCQDRYDHSLPLDPSCSRDRINITFRQFGYKS